jgi:hypothetical protein
VGLKNLNYGIAVFWTFPKILDQKGVSYWKDMDRSGKKCGNEGSSYGRRVLAENLRKLLGPEGGTLYGA